MEISETVVTIKLPPVKILDSGISKVDTDSFIANGDGINKNKITEEMQNKAISASIEDMKENVKDNEYLMSAAETRVKNLIENYIEKLGEASNTEYTVKWKYIEKE